MGTSIMGKYGDWMGIELTTELIAPSLQGTTPLEEFGDDLFELLPFTTQQLATAVVFVVV